MKRLLAFIVCLALVMTSFVFVSAEADATVTVATITQNVKAGDTVRIPVTISTYYDAYATIVIGSPIYDNSMLEFAGYEESEKDFIGDAVMKTCGEDFGIIKVPSTNNEAAALSGGEICLLVFTAKVDLIEDTEVSVEVKEIRGYTRAANDTTWVNFKELTSEVISGGILTTASADATITVATVEGSFEAGQEIAIPVNISEWPNAYATIELVFSYDESLLELDAIEPSDSDFSGAMSASNGKKFSIIGNPSSDRQAAKLLGGEICVAYFYSAVDNLEKATVSVTAIVKGYTNGRGDGWIAKHELLTNIIAGGVVNGEKEPDDTPSIPDGPVGDIKLGDVNEDGKINAMDAIVVSQFYVELPVNINRAAADVNGDDKINAMDAMLISQYYVELLDKFPAEK
ncbi:MAG: hypothetical protein IKT35_00165 [Clostridia bacterium]|nr:hypothetical protein [Clostridia bacterium]